MDHPEQSGSNKPVEIIEGRKENPENKSWREYFIKSKQEEINRFEDASKFLVGLISIILTLLRPNVENIGTILLLIALFSSLIVFFPIKYSYNLNFTDSLKAAHKKILIRKRFFFYFSTLLFLGGFCCLLTFKTKINKTKDILLPPESICQLDSFCTKSGFEIRKDSTKKNSILEKK